MVENVFNVFKEVQLGQKWVRIGKDPEKCYQMFAKSKVGLSKQYWPDEVPFEDMTINQALKTGFDFVYFDPANPFVDEVFERLGDCLVFNHFKKCPGSFLIGKSHSLQFAQEML